MFSPTYNYYEWLDHEFRPAGLNARKSSRKSGKTGVKIRQQLPASSSRSSDRTAKGEGGKMREIRMF